MDAVIKATGLTKYYDGQAVVDHVTLSVNAGEIFGLLGPNGAGKSTTVECLLGIRAADEGQVTVLGWDPRRMRKQLFRRVGVQFQENGYPEKITVEELCQEMASLYAQPADMGQMLARLELEKLKKRAVAELSGGQRQRLFIVLALIGQPDVVFLDELTTGLDVEARHGVWQFLQELRGQGVTIFLTSHAMEEVEQLCDRIGILRQGQLVFEGTIEEALIASAKPNLEAAYLWWTKGEWIG